MYRGKEVAVEKAATSLRYKSVWNESLFFCSNDINKLGNDQDFCV